jgi:molybdate transport system regulatory protein
MQPRLNLWIEEDGEVVLSDWRIRLLEAIAETGSISSAAARMNVSYHRAWDKIREMEQRLGMKLVEARSGGVGGGGASLTPQGVEFVEKFRKFRAGFREQVERRFEETFGR